MDERDYKAMNDLLSQEDGELYQDEFTRRTNGLLFKMHSLFNGYELTTWEYQEFIKILRSFCKEHHLHLDEKKAMIYKRNIA